jgi:hypothetical protein
MGVISAVLVVILTFRTASFPEYGWKAAFQTGPSRHVFDPLTSTAFGGADCQSDGAPAVNDWQLAADIWNDGK